MALDYAKDMIIDPDALDVEQLNQASLEEKYIQQLSQLRKEEQFAHEEVKIIRSELIRDAYDDPEKCCGRNDGKAPTAPQVEAYYRTHEKYKEAKRIWLEADDAFKVATDMKDNIHFTRSKALEGLIKLHGQSYFAGPNVPRNLSKEYNNYKENQEKKEELKEKRNEKMRKGMVRKQR